VNNLCSKYTYDVTDLHAILVCCIVQGQNFCGLHGLLLPCKYFLWIVCRTMLFVLVIGCVPNEMFSVNANEVIQSQKFCPSNILYCTPLYI